MTKTATERDLINRLTKAENTLNNLHRNYQKLSVDIAEKADKIRKNDKVLAKKYAELNYPDVPRKYEPIVDSDKLVQSNKKLRKDIEKLSTKRRNNAIAYQKTEERVLRLRISIDLFRQRK